MNPHTYQKILVPMDGSDNAQAALARAISLAQVAGDEAVLTILNVEDTRAFANLASFDDQLLDEVTQDAKESLDGYQKQAQQAGVKNVEYQLEFGNPKELIAHDIPTQLGSDVIVMGAGGSNAVEKLLLGSVAAYVTQAAKVDVLVVRSHLKQ